MAKFKVGDRVRIRQWADMEKEFGLDKDGDIKFPCIFTKCMKHLCGRVATVTKIYVWFGDDCIELKFDDEPAGGYCRSYSTSMIEPINAKKKTSAETIVIYRNGDTVTALDKRDGRKATAKCSPEDTFDFAVGARLAFDRLMGETKHEKEKKSKWYSGQVVCVKCLEGDYTVGKVYQVNNGKLTDDKGAKRPSIAVRLSSPTSYNGGLWEFIEYKGGAEK